MPSYRIPSDDRVRDSLVRILSTRPMVDSQRRLKQLVEKDLKGDEKYRVGEPRLRHLAIESGILDPARKTPGSIVSHGHMDHLTSGGIMTPQTVAVLKIRRGGTGQPLPYGKEIELNGFRVVLKDAGHVFGSAMVRVDDLLYTGDFNPEGGATCGRAQPEFVRDLIVDATYGRPGYNFPPKHDVESDLLNWLEMELANGPVALGGDEVGKSHELIAPVYRRHAELPLRDHGDFEDVMTFIEACHPRKVYTAFSGSKDLAKAVERRLKIRAEALLTR